MANCFTGFKINKTRNLSIYYIIDIIVLLYYKPIGNTLAQKFVLNKL